MKSRIFCSILVLAFVLSLMVVSPPGTALAEEGQRIYLTPESGPPKTGIMVTGQSFTPSTEANVYFDDELVATRQTDSAGNFTVSFYAPERSSGSYLVKAIDAQNFTASAYFRVRSEIDLSHQEGHVGTTIRVWGKGFDEWSHITIYYDNDKVDTARTDHYGSFVARFTIPESTSGRHEVLAVDDEDNEAMDTFRVTPEISLDCNSGTVGTEVEIKGTGFKRRDWVTIYYDDEELNEVRTDYYGSFTATLTVPESTAGEHKIKAVDTSSIRAKADFTVIPKISFDCNSGTIGTEVKIKGTGFKRRDWVTIYYDGKEMDTNPASVRTDYYGSFTATFTIPESQAGEHKVKAVDALTVWAKADFSVNPEVGLDPSFGAVGEKVTIEGGGFRGGSTITIYYDNQKLNTNSPQITSDHNGSFTATFTIPKSLHGQHIVAVTDTKGNKDEFTFTVESIPPLVPNLSSPVQGAETTSHTPVFDWSDVTDPSGVSYTLQIATNPQFSNLLLNKEGLSQSQYALTEGEALGRDTYYWRVKAVDGASNESPLSATWSLNIVLLPTWALITVVIAGVALVVGVVCYLLLRKQSAPRQRG